MLLVLNLAIRCSLLWQRDALEEKGTVNRGSKYSRSVKESTICYKNDSIDIKITVKDLGARDEALLSLFCQCTSKIDISSITLQNRITGPLVLVPTAGFSAQNPLQNDFDKSFPCRQHRKQ